MKLSRPDILAFLILLAVLIANAIGLSPELSISRVDLNDRIERALRRDEFARRVLVGSSASDRTVTISRAEPPTASW